MEEVCCCGHPKHCHDDIGVFTGWGMGKCDKCSCKNYLDKDWQQIKIEEERRKKAHYEFFNREKKVAKLKDVGKNT